MNLTPVYTEKSMKMAKDGIYTFWVLPRLTKNQIKSLIAKAFDVKVAAVKTLNYKAKIKKNWKGTKASKPALKKVLVTLAGKDKIELFDTEAKAKEGKK
jgi:large subunit ribosomal protein L23